MTASATAPHSRLAFSGAIVLPDQVLENGLLLVENGRIAAVHPVAANIELPESCRLVVVPAGGYLSPGFVDLHVHGGNGSDFMDGTLEAFRTVLAAHLRHGTTSLLPTSTAARHDQILAMLAACQSLQGQAGTGGARVLGAHFYGPYFHPQARGCHPGADVRPPALREYQQYLEFASAINTATVAPELPEAEPFARACAQHGIRLTAGHSLATFPQVAAAIQWGVRHVDHLYCAMSDKTKLRQRTPFPMQGGLLEAALYFDELTTEVIADGQHLSADLLLLALKIKGADRLALVTDCNRALDMPPGRYLFGPLDGGEPFENIGTVGVMPDGQSLASSVRGMDHMVRTCLALTGRPPWEVIRMASLTPARIAGLDHDLGSLTIGRRADLLILDQDLQVRQVYQDGLLAVGE